VAEYMNIQNWYIVQTKPSQEEKVIFYLTQKGISTYFPKVKAYIYKGLKRFEKIKPLFPGYVFAKCKKREVYHICWTRGVNKVLWKNTRPKAISSELIYSIKSLASKDGLIRKENFKKDDLVIIKSGPFKDILAIFDHWECDKQRVCLLLNLINAQIRVTLPAPLIAIA
jgi:transcriptional antiterminator RfaH